MKKIAIIFLFLLIGSTTGFAKNSKHDDNDSLKINIDKRTKAVISSNPAVKGYSLRTDIQELLKQKEMTLTDSTWRSIRNVVNSESAIDTTITISQGGKQIQIAFLNNGNIDASEESQNDEAWETNKNHKKEGVKIGKDGIHITDGNDEVHITGRGVQVIENGNEEVNIGFGGDEDSTQVTKRINKKSYGNLGGFNMFLGLNTLNGDAGIGYNAEDFELKPFGSRYFSMGWMRSTNVTNGENARLKVAIGLNFSWYNFMLDSEKNVWTKGLSKIELVPTKDNLRKSKLTASYIDVPLVMYVAFKKGKFIEYIGAGGYVGYNLNSHSKTKTNNGGKKDHIYNNFYLNDFRNGLTFQLGMHNFPDVFVNYDLNDLFKQNKGPKYSGLSFGIRL